MLRLIVGERFDDARATTTAEGFLEIPDAVIARAGVLEYRKGDGTVLRELRDPKVIHSKDALASYEGRPLLLGKHPTDTTGRVTLATESNTASLPIIGSIRNVRPGTAQDKQGRTHRVTKADVLIWHPDGVRAARMGTRQFSTGYRTSVALTPGTFEGESYDAKQTQDVGNHLVLTSSARAGDITEFRMDTSDGVATIDNGGLLPMANYTIDGQAHEVSADLLPLLEKERADAGNLASKLDQLAEQNAMLIRERDELAGKVAAFEAKEAKTADDDDKAAQDSAQAAPDVQGDSDRLEALVQARIALIDESRALVGVDYTYKGKTELEIRSDAVSAAIPDLTLEGMTEGEIKGAYMVALRSSSTTRRARIDVANATRCSTVNGDESRLTGKAYALQWYNDPTSRDTNKKEG